MINQSMDNEQTETDTPQQEMDEGEMAPPPQDPQLAQAFTRVVQAGLKIMYSPETRQILTEGLTQKAPIAEILAQEIAGLIKIMDDKAQGKIPRKTIIPAAVALMQDLVAFVKETGIADPTDSDARDALQKVVVLLVDQFKPGQETAEQPTQQQQMGPPPEAATAGGGLIGGQQ